MQLEYGATYQLSNIPFKHEAVESLDAMDYLGGGGINPRFIDEQYGGYWYAPTSPSAIFGTRSSRKDGRNRYTFWTEQQLLLQRDSARFLSEADPLAVGVLGQLCNFTVGEGAQVTAITKNRRKRNEPAERAVQARIDAFKERMAMECGHAQTFEEWCREYFQTAVVDGEKIDRIYCTRQGAITRRIEPEQVTQPPGGTDQEGWHLGVHCEPGDVTKRLGFHITYAPGEIRGEYVDARDVCFYKRNSPVTAVRGVSDFFPVTDDLADIGRLIDGIRVGAKVKSKIVFIRSVKGTTQQGMEDFVRKTADNAPAPPSRVPGSGRNDKTRETLPPGTAINAGDAVDFKTLPQGATDEYINAANFCIRNVLAVRWQIAEYMTNADASNNNFASLLASGGPPVRAFKSQQSPIAARIKMIIKRVLEYDIALGILPTGILDEIEIIVRFPSPVVNDPLAEAQVLDMMVQREVVSRRYWQESHGVDPDEENERIDQERERFGQMAQPLPNVFDKIASGGSEEDDHASRHTSGSGS